MGELGCRARPSRRNTAAPASIMSAIRADRARDPARRFRLPLLHVGVFVAGDAPDLCLWSARRSAANICPSLRMAGSSAASVSPCRPWLRSRLDDYRALESVAGDNSLPAPRPGSPIRRSPTSAVAWAKLDRKIRGFIVERGTKGCSAPRSKASFPARPPSPAKSRSKMPRCRIKISCRYSPPLPARSAASTWRAPASPGARWAPPNSACIAARDDTLDPQAIRPAARRQPAHPEKARRMRPDHARAARGRRGWPPDRSGHGVAAV